MALNGHGERGRSNGIAGRAASGKRLLFSKPRVEFRRTPFLRGGESRSHHHKLLLLTIVTSKVDNVRIRNRERPNTAVEISQQEYDEFKVLSAVDCNVVLEKSLAELAGLVRRKEVRYHKDLPPEIFTKLKTAILASPLVADEIKLLL